MTTIRYEDSQLKLYTSATKDGIVYNIVLDGAILSITHAKDNFERLMDKERRYDQNG